MAWPCISRVCCLARFWNQFDKSDLSVPLTIQNYSDIEQEVRSVTKQVPTDRIPRSDYSTPDHRGSPLALVDDIGTRGSFRGRREPSYKPREDYHPPDVPFPSVTQYKQDFKPWPIPRKETFPWISKERSRSDSLSDSPVNTYHNAGQKGERDERGKVQKLEEPDAGTAKTSSYRHEYRPWSGAKPAKSTRRSQSSPYVTSQSQTSQLPPETSYQAAFSGESHRSTGLNQGGQPSASFTPTPATVQSSSVMQPVATPLQTSSTRITCPFSLQQNRPSERNDLSTTTQTEEHLVRTKLPPNPSAVFQSGTRVFNI